MGKSDQYCACGKRSLLGVPVDASQKQLEGELWRGRKRPKDVGELRCVFVSRSILGVFLQVGADRKLQLRSDAPVFAAGTRELCLIPDVSPPTHYSSAIAEVEDKPGVARDTHAERGGNLLRFREFIIFRPTLIYPEYLVAYRRVKKPQP
eukprot:2448719-Prymnesium_polylepis.1